MGPWTPSSGNGILWTRLTRSWERQPRTTRPTPATVAPSRTPLLGPRRHLPQHFPSSATTAGERIIRSNLRFHHVCAAAASILTPFHHSLPPTADSAGRKALSSSPNYYRRIFAVPHAFQRQPFLSCAATANGRDTIYRTAGNGQPNHGTTTAVTIARPRPHRLKLALNHSTSLTFRSW